MLLLVVSHWPLLPPIAGCQSSVTSSRSSVADHCLSPLLTTATSCHDRQFSFRGPKVLVISPIEKENEIPWNGSACHGTKQCLRPFPLARRLLVLLVVRVWFFVFSLWPYILAVWNRSYLILSNGILNYDCWMISFQLSGVHIDNVH